MIHIRTEEEIKKIRLACKVAAHSLAEMKKKCFAGITTGQLDEIGEKAIIENGAVPIFKGYRGYKYATCISINNQVVHGIPGDTKIEDGDIVGLDVGVKLNGYCGDVAETVIVGRVGNRIKKLVKTAREALYSGIKQIKEGIRMGDLSAAIQKCAEKNGFSVVRDLFGHGIGEQLHEDPLIPNFGKAGEGAQLKAGMVFAIEPMLNEKGWKIALLDDGWTIVTDDGGYSAHFEHTIVVEKNGAEILSRS